MWALWSGTNGQKKKKKNNCKKGLSKDVGIATSWAGTNSLKINKIRKK